VTGPLLDDATIPDSAKLWSRIFPKWWVWDEKTNAFRLSSQAFENSRDGSGTSVILADESTLEEVLSGFNGYGLAAITAGAARAAQQGVHRVPLVDVRGHAQIEGKKSGAVRAKLVSAAEIIFPPTL
jgi:hypothetical protein